MGISEGGKRGLLQKVLIGLGILVVLVQFFRPSRDNPASDPSLGVANHLRIPPRVATMLRTSCFDCHSNDTRWPWYTNFAPVSWLVVRDVSQGRRRLNFSAWASYTQSRQVSLLGNIAEQVTKEEMPYPPYLILHSEARLSRAERDSIAAWANDEQDRLFGQQDDGTSGKE
jgi:hypothetical protein